jgi:hypothetical protein
MSRPSSLIESVAVWQDADGVIRFGEFKELYDHLGAGHGAEAATAEVRPTQRSTVHSLWACLRGGVEPWWDEAYTVRTHGGSILIPLQRPTWR